MKASKVKREHRTAFPDPCSKSFHWSLYSHCILHIPHMGKEMTCSWSAPLLSFYCDLFPALPPSPPKTMNIYSNLCSNFQCRNLKARCTGACTCRDGCLEETKELTQRAHSKKFERTGQSPVLMLRLFSITGPSNTPLSSGQSCCLQPGPLVKIVLHSEEESWDDFPTVAAAWSTCQAARLKALKRAEVHYSAARTPFVLKGTFTALVQRSCKSPVSSHLGVTGQHFGGSPSLPVWSLPAGLEGKASGHGPPQESNCFQMGQLVETKRSPITKLLINLHVEVPIRKCGMAKPQLASKPISARKHSSEWSLE